MRRILWAAILIPLLIVAVTAAIIASVTIGGNVKVINTSLTTNPTNLNWGTLCLSCSPANRTSTQFFSLTNGGQIALTLSYTSSCTPTLAGSSLNLQDSSKASLNGITLAAGATISAVNATLLVSGSPTAGSYSCGVTINGSA